MSTLVIFVSSHIDGMQLLHNRTRDQIAQTNIHTQRYVTIAWSEMIILVIFYIKMSSKWYPNLSAPVLFQWLCQIGSICFMYLGEVNFVHIVFMQSYTITSSHRPHIIHSFRLNYILNSFDKNLLTKSIVAYNLDAWNCIFDCFHDSIIIPMGIVLSNYLVCVKWHLMGYEVFDCFRSMIHSYKCDPCCIANI